MTRPPFEEHWRQRFTLRGKALDDDAGIAGWTRSGLETRLRHFKRLWPGAEPGSRWADIGCGAGSYSRYLADQGLRVIGIDYSHPSVVKARTRSPAVHEWIVGDATRLPLAPGSVDGILCFGVLQALAGSEAALTQMATALKPGGVLWVDALNSQCAPHRLRTLLKRPSNLRYETAAALSRKLVALGLEPPEVHWVPIAPGRLQRLQPLLELAPLRAAMRALPPLGAVLSHSVLLTARKPRAAPAAAPPSAPAASVPAPSTPAAESL